MCLKFIELFFSIITPPENTKSLLFSERTEFSTWYFTMFLVVVGGRRLPEHVASLYETYFKALLIPHPEDPPAGLLVL